MGGNQGTTDRDLLARAAAGDGNAIRRLFERHGPRCLHRARTVLRDAALAEDAVQEAFLDLWRTADRFDERRGEVVVWLVTLVHRRAVDIARREARRRLIGPGLPLPSLAAYTAEEEVLLLLDRRRVRNALEALSDPQRELLELAYYGGLTHRELSQRLGVPLGTIKSRMTTALARLAVAVA